MGLRAALTVDLPLCTATAACPRLPPRGMACRCRLRAPPASHRRPNRAATSWACPTVMSSNGARARRCCVVETNRYDATRSITVAIVRSEPATSEPARSSEDRAAATRDARSALASATLTCCASPAVARLGRCALRGCGGAHQPRGGRAQDADANERPYAAVSRRQRRGGRHLSSRGGWRRRRRIRVG